MKIFSCLMLFLFCSFDLFSQQYKPTDVPAEVKNNFDAIFPNATIESWKRESDLYIAHFTYDEMKGCAEFVYDGTWNYTKYTISEKELPGPIISDIKNNYYEYKIKLSEMVQEPGSADYYFIYVKKEGIAQPGAELYYTLAGKPIDKSISGKTIGTDSLLLPSDSVKNQNRIADSISSVRTAFTHAKEDELSNTVEMVSPKELPSPIITYIKNNYQGYAIKEAVLNISDKDAFYFVKIKKDLVKEVLELKFNIAGKYLEGGIKKEN